MTSVCVLRVRREGERAAAMAIWSFWGVWDGEGEERKRGGGWDFRVFLVFLFLSNVR